MPIITRIRQFFNFDKRPASLSKQFIDELGLYQSEAKHYPDYEYPMMNCLPDSDGNWSHSHFIHADSSVAMHHTGH